MDADLAGNLGLAQASLEKSDGSESPPFQLCKLFWIAFYAFWITHAQTIAWETECVTILYRNQ